MGYIPTPAQALEITKKYNKEPFHISHAETVGKVMAHFAAEYDPGREDYWKAVGLLHDIDFELYPEQHCFKAIELLHENDVDDDIIHSVISHGYGICSDVQPEHIMTDRPYRSSRSYASNGYEWNGNKVCYEEIQG